MPTETKELFRIIAALAQLVGELLEYLPYEAREVYRKKYYDIMGEKIKNSQ